MVPHIFKISQTFTAAQKKGLGWRMLEVPQSRMHLLPGDLHKHINSMIHRTS
jgi:hypothetical protein